MEENIQKKITIFCASYIYDIRQGRERQIVMISFSSLYDTFARKSVINLDPVIARKKIHTISYWIRSWWWMHLPTWMELGLFNIALMSTLLYYLFWGWVGDFWVYLYPYIDSQVSVHPYQASSITKVRTYNIISIWSGGHNHHQCHCYQKIVPVLWDSSFSHPWAK